MKTDQHDIEIELKDMKTRRRRQFRILIILIPTSVVFFVFGSIAFIQRNSTLRQVSTAQAAITVVAAQLETAQAANTVAVKERGSAQANADGAQLQATISRANELAAQSISLREKNFLVSILLGIEAYKKSDAFYSKGVLLDNARANPQLQVYLSGHTHNVHSAAFSPDGTMLAAGGFDNTILLWNTKTGQRIGLPLIGPQPGAAAGYTGLITSLAFSPDGKILAAGSFDTTIDLWDVSSGKLIGMPLIKHKFSLKNVVFSPAGNILASVACANPDTCYAPDEETILWDVKTWQPTETIKSGSTGITFSADGSILALAGYEKNAILLWDMKDHRVAKKLSTEGPVLKLKFFPNGSLASVLAGDQDLMVLWNISTGQVISSQPIGFNPSSFMFGPDENILISVEMNNILQTDIKAKQSSLYAGLSDLYRLDLLALSPDGNTVAVLGRDPNTVILLNKAEPYQPLGKLLIQQQPDDRLLSDLYIRRLAFSSDGKFLFSDSESGQITQWDAKSGQAVNVNVPKYEFKENERSIGNSPDGSIRISRNPNGTIILWDVKTNKPIIDLQKWNTREVMMAFSPDGRTLAFVQTYADLILWDVKTRQPIGEPLTGQVIAFSPDGNTLAAAFSERIILWDLNPQSWIDRTCQRAGRNLTRTEWAKYFPDDEYRATCSQWPLQPAEPAITP
jgi:WD40 repeat protein